MSIFNSCALFLLAIYRSKLLRFIIVFFTAIFLLYVLLAFYFVPSFLAKNLKHYYFQATGHQLQVDAVVFEPFKFTLALKGLKDSNNLWQAESVFASVELLQSAREYHLIVTQLQINKLSAKPLQRENGEWNFQDVLTHLASTQKKLPVVQTSSAGVPVVIKKISMTNADISSNVVALNNLPLNIAPLTISLTNVDLRKPTISTLVLNSKINQNTVFAINGSVNLQRLQAELDVNVEAVPFTWFNTALKPYVALEVLDGLIASHSHLSIHNGALKSLNTSGSLINVKVRPQNIEQDVGKLKSFEWNDLTVNVAEKTIVTPLLSFNEFDGQFIIHKDRSNNIQAMLLKPTKTAAATINTATNTTVTAPWKFSVEKIAINNAALGFYDQSLAPSFMVIVQQFTGSIVNLSSDPEQFAQIDLRGNVDGTAPVILSGKAQPFMTSPQLDVLFSFQKVDMGALTPYSSEYAGWRINKGLMSVDLQYRYEQGKIVGKNHVVIEHLEFGEKVRSPHLIDIPLRLGLALLTDENGVAVLDAEISGDPQSPNFKLGDIFMRALRNSVMKIIRSPFRFLSNLIHSSEDLGKVEFAAGESQLNAQTIDKLKLLLLALQKRPFMVLSAQGAYDVKADTEALKVEQVNSALQKQGVSIGALKGHNKEWELAVEAYYQMQNLTNLTANAAEKYQELVSLQVVMGERLHLLAHERALAVKQYFVLQLGVASEKILLDSAVVCEKHAKCLSSEVVFSLE